MLLALFTFQQPILTARSANLLQDSNPSFEQGITDWHIAYTYGAHDRIVDQSPGLPCGEKSLRFNFTENAAATVYTAYVPMAASRRYRFRVWLKTRGAGTKVALIAHEHDPSTPANTKTEVLVDNITTTKGKWKRIAGTFSSLETAGEGVLIVTQEHGTARLFIDCASIKPV